MWPFGGRKSRYIVKADAAAGAKPRQKGGRPTVQERAARLQAERERLRTELEVQQLRAKLRTIRQTGRQKALDVADLGDARQFLEELGFQIKPKGAIDNRDDVPGWLVALAQSPQAGEIVKALPLALGQLLAALRNPAPSSPTTEQAPSATTPPTPAELQLASSTATAAPSPAPSTPTGPATADVSATLIAELESRNPYEAADWLHKRPETGAKKLVEVLTAAPEAQIPAVLRAIGANEPRIASAMNWLLDGERYEPWTLPTIRELRRLVQAEGGA